MNAVKRAMAWAGVVLVAVFGGSATATADPNMPMGSYAAAEIMQRPVGEVVRVLRALPRGHSLAIGDVSDRTAAGRLSGLRLRRAMAAGEPLRAADLAPPVLVRRNARVTITWHRDALSLTDMGRALEDAALGEAVAVLNLSSRRTVEGRVTGAGRVAVGGR
ncbi:MAG: flagellar basal body P-ring formation chaperone FlgA [Pseudomonadota bacterium]